MTGVEALAGRLDARQAHGHVAKGVKEPHGVGAATDAGDDFVGQVAVALTDLRDGLGADHRLKVTDHGRVRRRAGHRADGVERVADGGDPVTQRLVHRVLEGARTALDGDHGSAQQTHAYHVELLAAHVFAAHVHGALEVEERAGRGRGHAVLAGAGLGDHAGLAHALREKRLAEDVVDLVGAGVAQVLALEQDGGCAALAEARGMVQRRGAAGVVARGGARARPGRPRRRAPPRRPPSARPAPG